MKISRVSYRRRAAWELDNDVLRVTLLAGGGHIARVVLHGREEVNPLWQTPWPTYEPWAVTPRIEKQYGSRLLAGIAGHNLCLGWFGDPSAEETRAGMGCHGEAPVARWRRVSQRVARNRLQLVLACDLPAAQMRVTRTLTMLPDECNVRVCDTVQNMSRRDLPYTLCQHVTIGPPFLDPGVTVVDMPATTGHTFPGVFSVRQRLKADASFAWPRGPGAKGGAVDLRRLGTRASSDFSAQLIDPRREHAWVSALNPKLGLMLAYVWRREDYPWVGNWEENRARRSAPWNGRTLARGLEFANTPFPVSLRAAVDRGTFQGQKTFRWLPARCKLSTECMMLLLPVPTDVEGVEDIRPVTGGFEVDLR